MKQGKIFIGIDVSKGYSDFAVFTSKKEKLLESFQLDDTYSGHQILRRKIEELTDKGYQVICGVENTGGYERNWVNGIRSFSSSNSNVEIYKLNPKAVKHQIASMLRRTIDDGVSAEGIAMYMINNYSIFKENWQKSMDQKERITEEKIFLNMIFGKIRQNAARKNQLEKVLYQTFPEMLKFVKNSVPKWICNLLEKYPSAAAVKRAKMQGLTSIRGVSQTKAEHIKERARTSVASANGDLPELVVSEYCQDILYHSRKIEEYKKLLVNSYKNKNKNDLQILTSMKGIGEWIATAFLIELGDYSRFKTGNQIAAFYGVNPSFKQSGDGKYKTRMSKQGSAQMRYILFLAAHELVMHNDYFKKLYARHAAKGKKHGSIMGILMHKALRVMWGMLKAQMEFNPEIDLKNQNRNEQQENRPVLEIDKASRRFQELTLEAPISRSNRKKRRAVLEPQSSTLDERTRSSKHSPTQT